jgi:MFS family permease
MGKIADRIGKRNAVIGSMFVVSPLIAVGPFLAYLPVDPWVRLAIMIPGLLVAGVAYAFLLPAWHALALGRIPEEQRGRSLAILMSVEMAALAAGHAIGTPIYTKVHFSAPFLMAGAVFAILAGLYLAGHILPPEIPDDGTH